MFSVGRMQIRHFRRFRQNGPFLAGDKNTVYQKHGLCHPEVLFAANGGSDPSWLNLALLGRPDFQSRGPQIPIFKGFWDLWTENRGAPKTPNSTTTDLTPHLRHSEFRGDGKRIYLHPPRIASHFLLGR